MAKRVINTEPKWDIIKEHFEFFKKDIERMCKEMEEAIEKKDPRKAWKLGNDIACFGTDVPVFLNVDYHPEWLSDCP